MILFFYIIGMIATTVGLAFVYVKYDLEQLHDGGICIYVLFVVFWPITVPIFLIIIGIYKFWNSLIKHFKLMLNK